MQSKGRNFSLVLKIFPYCVIYDLRVKACYYTYRKDRKWDSSAASATTGATFLLKALWIMCVRSWKRPLLQCSAIIRWAADPCLVLMEAAMPQVISYFICALSLLFCFPLQPCTLHSKLLSKSTLSAPVTDYMVYWAGLTVPEKSQSLGHPYWQLSVLIPSWVAREIPWCCAQIPKISWINSVQPQCVATTKHFS